MIDCPQKEKILKHCNCTYTSCERKGICCECILYHRRMKQLPACLFSEAGEATYDRSIENFKLMHF